MGINYIKKFLWYVLMYGGLIILYVIFLMVGQMIPRRLIMDNAIQSYNQLKQLGLYFTGIDGAGWDNWTDTFFINSAVTEYDGDLLQRAIANAYTTFSELDDSGSANVIDDIKYALDNDGTAEIKPYSRYWAGMMPIYKVLLIFMPVNGIRTLVFGVAIVLFTVSVLCVYKTLGVKGLIPYLVSVVIAQYIPQAMCLVFNTDINIMFFMMIICCIMLNKKASVESFYILFFLAGSILAYLNYWAFPLITLGFPLVLVLSRKLAEEYDIICLTKETVFMSVSWGAGLAGTVLVKQFLCKIVLGTQSGTEQLLMRMGAEFTVTDRLVEMTNGLVRRMESPPVLILTIITTIWFVTMLITGGGYTNKCRRFLFILIALFPVIWWFVLANHCRHGFVKHMYGVTYYALLSAVLIKCDKLIPNFGRFRFGKEIGINLGVFVMWVLMSYGLFHTDIHYGSRVTEPWSLETVGTARIEETVTQKIHFEDLPMGTAYLKNISTILVNLPEDRKDGILHVEFSENGTVISTSEIQIADVVVGDWFRIPIGCIVALAHEYQVTYTVYGNELSEPCLLIQDQAQATRENDMLYINGLAVDGALANKYEVVEFTLSKKAKMCIAFLVLAVVEYGLSLFRIKESTSERL